MPDDPNDDYLVTLALTARQNSWSPWVATSSRGSASTMGRLLDALAGAALPLAAHLGRNEAEVTAMTFVLTAVVLDPAAWRHIDQIRLFDR